MQSAPAPPPAPAKPLATYAELEALPEHVVGEILAGELVVSPRPAVRHANAASTLGAFLNLAFHVGVGGPGGWWILHEPELSLGVDRRFPAVVPDLAGWRRETTPAMPDVVRIPLVPQWVCEVLSPGTQRHDRVLKVPFYARAGVRHCWLVDALAQTLEVYRLEGDRWVIVGQFGGDEIVRAEPFEAVELPLRALWDLGEPAPDQG